MNWPPVEVRPTPSPVSPRRLTCPKDSAPCVAAVGREDIGPRPSGCSADGGAGRSHPAGGMPWPGSDRDSRGPQGLSVLLAPGTSFGDVGMWGYLSPLQRTRTLLRAGCGHVILRAWKAGHDPGRCRSLWGAFGGSDSAEPSWGVGGPGPKPVAAHEELSRPGSASPAPFHWLAESCGCLT